MPAISVIMPVYNSVMYLQSVVDSVLNQDFSDFELLLMDDGSTDGSSEVCDSIASQDARVRVFHLENGGQCRARNIALNQARGEYVAFCDNDDYCLPGFLSNPYRATEAFNKKIDCVCFGRYLRQYSSSGSLVYESECKPSKSEGLFGDDIFLNFSLWKECSEAVWCRLYRRSFLKENQIFFDETLRHGGEDNLFNVKVLACLRSVVYISKSYYAWIRRESHSSSMGISEDTLRGLNETLKIESSLLIDKGVSSRDPKLFGEKLLENFVFQIINVRYKTKPSYKEERELYRQLREMYLPYCNVINRDVLPFAYRLEFELVIKEHYRFLYNLLRISGFLKKVQPKNRRRSC